MHMKERTHTNQHTVEKIAAKRSFYFILLTIANMYIISLFSNADVFLLVSQNGIT